VKKLQELIEKTVGAFLPTNLFSENITIYFRPEERVCPTCNALLKVRKTEKRTMVTLHIGKFSFISYNLFELSQL